GLLRRPRPGTNSGEGRGSRGASRERCVRSSAGRAPVPRYLGESRGPRVLCAARGNEPALTSHSTLSAGAAWTEASWRTAGRDITFQIWTALASRRLRGPLHDLGLRRWR